MITLVWWSYCTNFSLGNFSILLLFSNYQLDTDVSHFLWLMFLCVPRCIITWHVIIFHTWKLKVGLDLCYCGKEVKLLLWISWTILSCNSSENLCLSMAGNQTKKNTETIGLHVIAQHGFHVKVCPVTCTTCEPISMNVATAPTDQIEQIPLYPRLSDTEIETENLWLLKMKNKHNNILYN